MRLDATIVCSTRLIILGGILQVAGFVFVAWDLDRIRRREFGPWPPWQRLKGRVRRLLGLSKVHTLELGDIAGTSDTALALRIRKRPPEGADLDARVRALEDNFGYLEKEIDQHRQEGEKATAELRKRLDENLDQLHAEKAAAEARNRQFLSASLRLQGLGIGCFVVGTALSVWGSLI